MSSVAPVPTISPPEEDAVAGPPLWRRWLDHPWARTIRGLLVLAAILGGLLAIDRLSGGEVLGPLDSQTPKVGEPAPLFVLNDPDGNVLRLSDFQGRVVWVNFWATWCGPCRRELPDIQRLASEFGDEELVVLAVNLEESDGKARSFWEELGLDLPLALDATGDVANQYRLVGLPNNFFIDKDGVLRAFQLGFLTEEQMRERLAEVGLSGPSLLDGE